MKRHIGPILLVLVLSFWVIRPLLTAGFFPMHDDTQVGRVIAMGRALRNGQFPVRWVSDLGYGYGYPIFNFYGPLPYYVGGSFYALGLSGLTATKIMFIMGLMLAGFAMYAFVASVAGRVAGMTAAILYSYAPYHAVEAYVRGAVGEQWVLMFIPLIAWGFTLTFDKGKRTRGVLIGGFSFAGAILSHTLLGYVTALGVFGTLFTYWIAAVRRRQSDASLLAAHVRTVVIGLGVSAFFWLPAIAEMGYTSVRGQIGPTAYFRDHFVCIGQLWSSPWGYGGSAPGCADGLSFKLGKIQALLAAIGMLAFLSARRKTDPRLRSAMIGGLAVTVIALFLMVSPSFSVWEIVPYLRYLQYPWRFLSFAAFGLALLSSGVFLKLSGKALRVGTAMLIVLGTIGVNAKLFVPQYTDHTSPESYEDIYELRYRVSKISDEYLPTSFTRPQRRDEIALSTIPQLPGMSVESVTETETYRKYVVESVFARDLVLNSVDFPGWRYFINGQPVSASVRNGNPVLSLSEGPVTLEMRFTDTPVRSIGNILSILTLASVVFVYGKKTVA